VDVLWWDFSSENFQGDEAWRATELMKLVRAKQPHIIVNNRLYSASTVKAETDEHSEFSTDRGDFTTPEQRIPATGMPGVDWETCMTLNTTWGYSDHDHAWKSDATLIRNLVNVASKGGNYLLNIGPKGDGSLTAETVRSFEAIGAWMKTNGEAIYGTTASPFNELNWGRATRKGPALYLTVFDWPKDRKLHLPLRNHVEHVSLLADPRATLSISTDATGKIIELPATAPDSIANVIKLIISGKPDVINAESHKP
jgi:alpha-L-fucosidase